MTRSDYFSLLGLLLTLWPLAGPLPPLLDLPDPDLAGIARWVALLCCLLGFAAAFGLTRGGVSRKRMAGCAAALLVAGLVLLGLYRKLFVDWFPEPGAAVNTLQAGLRGAIFGAAVAEVTLCLRLIFP